MGYSRLTMCGSFKWTGIHIHVSILSQIPLPSRLAYNIEQSSMCLCPFLNQIFFNFCYRVHEFVIYFWLLTHCIWLSSFLTLFIEEITLSSLSILGSLLNCWLAAYLRVYFWALDSFLLINESVFYANPILFWLL